MKYKGAIFDLDGVLVDTAKYHYIAWKKLADQLGFEFTKEDNERLKGVSRMESLNILLEIGNMKNKFTDEQKENFAKEKNDLYVSYICEMKQDEILDGALDLLKQLKEKNVKIALGSASKNALMILNNTNLKKYFDVIIDGNKVSKAKPDPEVFSKAADELKLDYKSCIVFEDSQAGLQAAKEINMLAVGIGAKENLTNADVVFQNLLEFNTDLYF